VAPASDPGENPSGITLELGSLYVGDANSPAPGTGAATVMLCKLHYTGTTNSTLTLAANATRGGVVNEDGTAASPTLTGTIIVFAQPLLPPTGLTASDGTSATQKTLTWTASSGATAYDVYYNNKNNSSTCVLLASNIVPATYAHVTNHGETTWYWVKAKDATRVSDYSTPDSGYLTECYPNTVPAKKTRWVTLGRPDCWCYARNCKGDADGLSSGKSPTGPYWVSNNDLNILKSGWSKLDAALAGNQPCADFDRATSGKSPTGPYGVSNNDLNILKSNWSIVNGPAPGCEASKAVVAPSGPMP
jgi:hypothetical protein